MSISTASELSVASKLLTAITFTPTPELAKLITKLVILGLTTFVFQICIQRRIYKITEELKINDPTRRLYDPVQNFLAKHFKLGTRWKWLDYLHYFYLLTTLLIMREATRIENFMMKLYVLFILRAIINIVTILPQCDFTEKPVHVMKDSLAKLIIKSFTFQTEWGFTNDLLPSGHVILMCLSCLHVEAALRTDLSDRLFLDWNWGTTLHLELDLFDLFLLAIRIIIWPLTVLFSLAIIARRKHYSIDVIFGFILTCFVYKVMG